MEGIKIILKEILGKKKKNHKNSFDLFDHFWQEKYV
jgi:hypothetical protein